MEKHSIGSQTWILIAFILGIGIVASCYGLLWVLKGYMKKHLGGVVKGAEKKTLNDLPPGTSPVATSDRRGWEHPIHTPAPVVVESNGGETPSPVAAVPRPHIAPVPTVTPAKTPAPAPVVRPAPLADNRDANPAAAVRGMFANIKNVITVGGVLGFAVTLYFGMELGRLNGLLERMPDPSAKTGSKVTPRTDPPHVVPLKEEPAEAVIPEAIECSRCTASGDPISALENGVIVYHGSCSGTPGCEKCTADYSKAHRDEATGHAVGGTCR